MIRAPSAARGAERVPHHPPEGSVRAAQMVCNRTASGSERLALLDRSGATQHDTVGKGDHVLATTLPLHRWIPLWVWVVLFAFAVGAPVFFVIVGLFLRPFTPGWGEWMRAYRERFGETVDPRSRSSKTTNELRTLYRRWRSDRKTSGASASDWLALHGPVLLGAASSEIAVPPANAAVPDWYADPWRRFALRYWDGRTWTEHVSSEPGSMLADAVPEAPPSGASGPAGSNPTGSVPATGTVRVSSHEGS
jgi:Protein of unknown function (DUF2510)